MLVYALKPQNEEEGAVIVAKTSRHPETFSQIQEIVQREGYQKFLETNVLGYGHDSVAEGAMTPWIAIENISDLAGNVIATSDPQMRVQMTSTRYQDMASRTPFAVNEDAESLYESANGLVMRNQYSTLMTQIGAILERTDHPRKRTLQCDIARSFLPAGISTQLAIRADARAMRDAICFMLGHPLHEVRRAATEIVSATQEVINTLLGRHIAPASPSVPLHSDYVVDFDGQLGRGFWREPAMLELADMSERHPAIVELTAWRQNKWRRRFRLASAPFGPYPSAIVAADWGAFRDLKRNRTLHQSDLLPQPFIPKDPLWGFRDLYPDTCKEIEDTCDLRFTKTGSADPYLAPMGSLTSWGLGGHIFNWAYAMRLRTPSTCHPSYALPMRSLMVELMDKAPLVAKTMGIVCSEKSLLGVEFADRVPS